MVVHHPSSFVHTNQVNDLQSIQLGNLVLTGIKKVIEILRIVEVAKGIAVLKTDHYTAFRFLGILLLWIVVKHKCSDLYFPNR